MSSQEPDERVDHGRRNPRTIGGLREVGTVFIRERKESHLTERGLAKRLGVSESQIRCWEDDTYCSATIDQAQQVADTLGMQFSVTAHFKEL